MHMGEHPFILLKGLMMKTELTCPKCGAIVEKYLNPKPTVDIVIHDRERGLVLVDRKNPPYGNALPGGFIDLGESAEQAAVREAFEETNLRVKLTGLLGVYSAPDRDPRQHTISTVFIAEPLNPEQLRAGDDAAKVAFYSMEALPALVFDHAKILADFKGRPVRRPFRRQAHDALVEAIGEGRGNPSEEGSSPLTHPSPSQDFRVYRIPLDGYPPEKETALNKRMFQGCWLNVFLLGALQT